MPAYVGLSDNFVNLLKEKVTIIDYMQMNKFDDNYNLLRDRLLQTKKEHYNSNEYYLVCQYEAKYYLPSTKVSLGTYNFVRTFQDLDISLGRVIFVTNNVGCKEEFELLIPKHKHNTEMPVVFDDYISIFDLNHLCDFACANDPVDVTAIKKHAISMLGIPRPHRNSLYRYFKENGLLDQVAVSYNKSNK